MTESGGDATADAPSDEGTPLTPERVRLGWILLAAVTVGWGLNWPAMKISLNEIEPWTFRALVTPVSALILLSLARASGVSLHVPRQQWPVLIAVSLLNITGWQILAAYGISQMPAGRSMVIAYTMPVWASIFGVVFLAETMTRGRIAALVLGMSGIGILLVEETEALAGAPWGALCTLGAAVSWAGGLICLKKVTWRVATLPLAGWQLLIGGLPYLGGAFIFEKPNLDGVSTAAFVAIAFTIIWPICFNHWAFFKVVTFFPASVCAVGTMLAPVIGVFAAGYGLGEGVGWPEIAALVLVCAALACELKPSFGRRKRGPSP